MTSKLEGKDGHQAVVMATESSTTAATIVALPSGARGMKNDLVQNISPSLASSATASKLPDSVNFLVKNGQMIIQQPLRGNGPAAANNGNALNSLSKSHIIVRQKSSSGGASSSPAQLGEIIERVGMKRPHPSSGNSIVTKVIITKNPVSGQPQAQPVRPVTQTVTLQGGSGSGGSVNQQQLQQLSNALLTQSGSGTSIAKTLTLSSQALATAATSTPTTSSPVKTVIATIPSSGVTKISVPYHKIPTSPAKTPTKITMIPVSKSPITERLFTGQGKQSQNANITVLSKAFSALSQSGGVSLKSGSPSKVIIKQGPAPSSSAITLKASALPNLAPQTSQIVRANPQAIKGLRQPQAAISVRPSIVGTSSGAAAGSATTAGSVGAVQPIQVPGSRFNYVRLVNVGGTSGTQQLQATAAVSKTGVAGQTQTLQLNKNSMPITVSASAPQANQVKITLPVHQNTLLLQQMNKPLNTQAGSIASVDPAPPPLRQPHYVPIASIDPAITQYTLSRNAPPQNGPTLEATGARPRKPCNCTKSQCLKLYCDCFANGEFCQNCNCTNCANNLEHEEERSKAIKCCLDRNPQAFHPKIGKAKDVEGNRRHTKGCNCKRSGCLKNYCECYEAKIMCSEFCKCVGCKNFEESPERKTLMHLADAAEVRVQQQTAAKTKLSSQISSVPSRPPVATASGERLPFALITADVAEATSACLLAQAEEAERMKMPPVVQERMVIEEFGRCLMQIIESANRTRTSTMS
ncbi:Lin-54-like protein [Elysia marginata]|uniref:Lin-54-like protein n=1 Tax=Elysia marginata TaxID=1093978 RepID=A0AAV4G0L0_9GAST|nr:Lin-54-like protein [Elysia marginata]